MRASTMSHLMPICNNVVVERLGSWLGGHFFSEFRLARRAKALKKARDLICVYATKYLTYYPIDEFSDSRIIARTGP